MKRSDNIERAISWIEKRLNEEDITDFYLEPHLYCKSLHRILRIYKNELESAKFFVLDNAYYQVKKIKDNYNKYGV